MSNNAFVISPPQDNTSSRYFLILYRSGPFGSTRPTVVAIDQLNTIGEPPFAYRGMKGGQLVVEFPAPSSYVLLDANLVEVLSTLDAAKREKAEEDEIEKIWPRKGGVGGSLDPFTDLAAGHPGNYA